MFRVGHAEEVPCADHLFVELSVLGEVGVELENGPHVVIVADDVPAEIGVVDHRPGFQHAVKKRDRALPRFWRCQGHAHHGCVSGVHCPFSSGRDGPTIWMAASRNRRSPLSRYVIACSRRNRAPRSKYSSRLLSSTIVPALRPAATPRRTVSLTRPWTSGPRDLPR